MASFRLLTRGDSAAAPHRPPGLPRGAEPQFPTSCSTTQSRRPSFSSFLLLLVLPGFVSLINHLSYGTQGLRLFPQKNQWKKRCMKEEHWGEIEPRNGEEGASWLQGMEGYRHRIGIVRGRCQYRGGIPTSLEIGGDLPGTRCHLLSFQSWSGVPAHGSWLVQVKLALYCSSGQNISQMTNTSTCSAES